MTWIYTNSGQRVYLDRPDPEVVRLEDIAALAHLCRYVGQSPRFYSVAEHSLLVASILPPPLAPYGLLHDGHEAYLGDISAPLKRALVFDMSYNWLTPVRLAEAWDDAIFTAFGLAPLDAEGQAAVHAADMAVGAAEIAAFGWPDVTDPSRQAEPAEVALRYWPPDTARAIFAEALLKLQPEGRLA